MDIFDTAERGVSVFGGFAIVIFDTFIPVYLERHSVRGVFVVVFVVVCMGCIRGCFCRSLYRLFLWLFL